MLSRKVDECKPLLTGLRGAPHLNGKEGVIRGRGVHTFTFRPNVSAL